MATDLPSSASWPAWPCCPQCGQRRHAVCPICHQARQDLPLAEDLTPGEDLAESRERPACCAEPCGTEGKCEELPILLLCPACDEAFPPQFHRQCHGCGHDFGDGVLLPDEEPVSTSGRAFLLLFVLVALVVGLVAYFAHLFRQ